jgi:hypothetical protein
MVDKVLDKVEKNHVSYAMAGIAVLIIIALWFVYRSAAGILETVGLKESATDRAVNQARHMDAFNPNWWKIQVATPPRDGGSWAVYTIEACDARNKIIYDAINGITNSFGILANVDTVAGVFRQARSKVHVSRMAERYFAVYRRSLFENLDNRLLRKDLKMITDIVDKLPDKVKLGVNGIENQEQSAESALRINNLSLQIAEL